MNLWSFNYLYPLRDPDRPNKILHKYLYGKTFEPGKSVWEQYESKNYDKIESRVIDEVISTYKSYNHIKNDFEKFKSQEKKVKNLKKKIERYREQIDSLSSK